tara:strand:- start:219 stop:971 length:753 start_codon:yes stop_codon:yes gene_type:complete
MSNFFDSVLKDANTLEDEIFGPNYEYWKQIKNPKQLGMSTDGTIQALSNDIAGLIDYTEVLVTGKSKASKTGQPLGNKFFFKTAGTCKAKDSNKIVDRYLYVNNVPDGNIPFISSGMGQNFGEFRGLVPGTLGNVADINPLLIFQAFMQGENPPCQQITLQTIDADNKKGIETQYVATSHLESMNPCAFKPQFNKNPVTGKPCREGFSNINNINTSKIPDDILVKTFYASLGVLGIYLLIELLRKIKDNK